jgi:hypothetical protein
MDSRASPGTFDIHITDTDPLNQGDTIKPSFQLSISVS